MQKNNPVPGDVVFEILLRLPAKSIGRFVCVSKLWERIIRGEDFVRWFSLRSSPKKQPRFLFAVNGRTKTCQEYFHFFSKQTLVEEKKPLPLAEFLSRYDPVNAQYKVLCLFTNVTRFRGHQVITLGGAQNWRTIQCPTPHLPLGPNSVCIDGVLYYTASGSFANMEQQLLVGFDLRSETLEIASILPKRGMGFNKLLNYHGKVALVTRAWGERYTFILWVLKDAKRQDWSKQRLSFSLNSIERKHHSCLKMLGVSEMGEFVYASIQFKELYVYFVDHKSNRVRSVELLGNTKHIIGNFDTSFLHHVETLMFI
ncbi:PREDICTED: putative F-box protein At1g47800 [Camelina sativa]|uniref:F-box protein At1g47800 n=1 Tax=Camelina sativa TaxID=90675 RepID=A0ABM0Y3Y3_CAMSA|nr:PREDICTED: putative F-box protein At1g47800 [Camelina sativa]